MQIFKAMTAGAVAVLITACTSGTQTFVFQSEESAERSAHIRCADNGGWTGQWRSDGADGLTALCNDGWRR